MPDEPNRSTYVRETEKTSGGGIALIVGGLVVAVAFIAWLLFDGSMPTAGTAPAAGDTNTNVTVEVPAAEPAPPAEAAPAEPVAPAADPAPAAPPAAPADN